jgi:WD40 repeat protein
LLEAHTQREVNIYVVLTMRSDFLGDCAEFWDLPEAVNEGQYLIPRLTRDQLREAITGPIAVAGGKITARLVTRLLNDIGDNQDQLPVLQHLLMRGWDEWKEKRLEVEVKEGDETVKRPHKDVHNGDAIDLCCYEAVGGMAEALSRHADEAFNELPDDRHRQVAEKLFKALTEKGEDNREIRRPITVAEICAVSEAGAPEVKTVIEAFRLPGRSFLMPPAGTPLDGNSLIDISHESLIRGWQRLREWVDEEARSARVYRRLAETAELNLEGGAGLWGNPDLQLALDWQEKNRPNKAWAVRYHPGFEAAIAFLQASERKRADDEAEIERRRRAELEQAQALALAQQQRAEAERQKVQEQQQRLEEQAKAASRSRRLIATLVLMVLFAVAAAAFAFFAYRNADQQQQLAEERGKTNSQLLYVANMNLAHKAFEDGDSGTGQELLNAYLPTSLTPEPDDLRSFDWYYLWHLNHNEKETLKGHTDPVNSVAFSPDGRMLASGCQDNTVKLWDVSTRQELATLNGHTNSVFSVAFSPDGKTIASGGADNTVKLWNASTRQELATLKGHASSINTLAFSPDGKTIASGSTDTTVKLWDVSTRQELTTLKGHASFINTLALSPDGKTIASGSEDNTVKLWDVSTRQELATLKGHADYVFSLAFSPDGKTIVTGSEDNKVKLWDVSTRQELVTFNGHASYVRSVAFSPDGKTIASGSADKTVKLWDASTGQELASLNGHTNSVFSLAFSPDGKMLASGSADKTVKLWDASTRQELATLKGHTDHVLSAAFSPDGRTIATASMDKTVKLWNASTRQELATLKGHTESVISAAFSPDKKRMVLASGSADKTVRLWFAATDEEIAAQRSK